MSSYFLEKMAFSSTAKLAISESEFASLRVAMDCLVHSLLIEEKYDFVIQNYKTLEHALMNVGDFSAGEVEIRYAKSEINRHFANILTTTRLYVDQGTRFGKKLDRLYGEPLVQFTKRTNIQYDAKLGYRVMEALRNFVQHRGDAVHQIAFGFHREFEGDAMQTIKRTDTYLDPIELRKERKFNSAVLRELEALSTRPTAKILLEEYLHGLAIIHSEFREAIRDKINESEACIANAFERFRQVAGDVIGLHAFESEEHDKIRRYFAVIDSPIIMRKFYESKNLSSPDVVSINTATV